MINIAICDDDVFMASEIEKMVINISKEHELKVNTEVFSDGETLWQGLENGEHYDLIYLDIEMERMDGITVAKRIRQKDEVVQFIYVSSYDTYCKEILEVEPFRFLDKPIDTDKFEEIFMKVCERITDVNRCFVCQFGGANYRIPYKDIMYFQSEKREIHVYTKEAKVRYYGKMNEVQAQVDRVSRFFIRTHKSVLVNFFYIKRFGPSDVELMDGTILTLRVKGKSEPLRKYLELVEEES